MKNELRKKALELRKQLDITSKTKKILENIFSLSEYKSSNNILCYYPLKYEVSTIECLKRIDKNWFLPRVKGHELEICSYSAKYMSKGSFNIIEPQTTAIVDYNCLDMIIIPAVAVDIKGYRIGYGKGYYDKFLAKINKKIIKVIPIYSELIFDTVYPEKHDIRADIIISEKEILRI